MRFALLCLVLLACNDEAPPPRNPALGVAGIGEDKTLGFCVSEPDRAYASFALRNDSDSRLTITLTANTNASPAIYEVVAEVPIMPGAIETIQLAMTADVRTIRLSGSWDNGWYIQGEIEARVTVDESLLDVEPAKESPIGGDTALLLVRNRSGIETSFDIELDRALAFDESVPLVRTARPGLEQKFGVRVVDAERSTKVWYEPSVRLRGASCKAGVSAPRVTALSRFELRRAESVSAGRAHTCVRTTEGEVRCWGSNAAGQIGRESKDVTEVVKDPTKVEGLPPKVEEIASGESHTCALAGGEVRCWGYGGDGQVGPAISGTHGTLAPVNVVLPRPAKKIFAGWRGTCATLDDDRTMCWGMIAQAEANATPTELASVGRVSAMTLGLGRACALADDGALSCWGVAPGNGASEAASPVVVSNAIRGIAGTEDVTCGLHAGDAEIPAGSVVCWGRGSAGTELFTPKVLPTPDDGPIASLSGGSTRICRHGAKTICGLPFGIATAVASEPVQRITNGASHMCWILGGRVMCSGRDDQTGTANVDGFVAGFGP